MTYGLPGQKELDLYLGKLIGESEEIGTIIEKAKTFLQGCSFADIEQIILKAKRKVIIEDSVMTFDKIVAVYAAYNPRTLKEGLDDHMGFIRNTSPRIHL